MVKNANNSVYRRQRIMPLPIHGHAALRQLMSVIGLSSENENNTVLVTTTFQGRKAVFTGYSFAFSYD